MNVLMRVMLTLVFLLLLPPLGIASEPSAQRGAPIAEFLDAQGRLRMPDGYTGSLDPKVTLSKKPFPLAMTIMQQLPRGFESNSPQMPLGI